MFKADPRLAFSSLQMLPLWAPYQGGLQPPLATQPHRRGGNSGARSFCWSQHLWLLREAPAPPWSLPSSLFANRHPTTAYPEERSRGGESEDTPAHTVPGEDAADNTRWISSTVPNWKWFLFTLSEDRRTGCRSWLLTFQHQCPAGAWSHI